MIGKILISIIYALRPLLGPQGYCRFKLSCTDYASNELTTNKLHVAIYNIVKRVFSCHPFC